MLDGYGNKIDTRQRPKLFDPATNTSPRIAYDNVCCIWMHDDRSIELSPLPIAWKHDYRGSQIRESRRERGHRPEETTYAEGDPLPTQSEIDAVVRARMERRATSAPHA